MDIFEIIYDHLIIIPIISLFISIILIVSSWKLFVKAGESGWKSVVPIYNLIIWLRIAKLPLWLLVFLGLPIISLAINNIILLLFSYSVLMAIYIYFILKIAKIFNQKDENIVGLIMLPYIFFPIMAFLPDNKVVQEQVEPNLPANPAVPVANIQPTVIESPITTITNIETPIEVNPVPNQPINIESETDLSSVSNLSTEVIDSSIVKAEESVSEPTVEAVPVIVEAAEPLINIESTTVDDSIVHSENITPVETVPEQPIINLEEVKEEISQTAPTSPKLIRFCSKCGSQIIDNTSYCINCGVKL